MPDSSNPRDIQDLADKIANLIAETMGRENMTRARASLGWSPCDPSSAFTQCGTYDCPTYSSFKCTSDFRCNAKFTAVLPSRI
jgi:hypothetical protein